MFINICDIIYLSIARFMMNITKLIFAVSRRKLILASANGFPDLHKRYFKFYIDIKLDVKIYYKMLRL